MQSYPFTSQVTYDDQGLPLYDRAVDSEFLRETYKRYFEDGVFYKPTTAFQVTPGTGMNVLVSPGACQIQGAIGIETAQRTLAVQAAEAQDRIDSVVLRLDLSLAKRDIDLYIVKGTAAVSPAAPALTRNATVWELGIADLFIAKNSSAISQQRITDTRLNNDRCGLVAQTIGTLDTSPYFAQVQAMIDQLQDELEGVEDGSGFVLSLNGKSGNLTGNDASLFGLSVVASIPQNADLNTYTTPGVYDCADAATAGTVQNTPVTAGAFKLIVLYNGSQNALIQMMYSAAMLYFRSGGLSSGAPAFSAWAGLAALDSTGKLPAAALPDSAVTSDGTPAGAGSTRDNQLQMNKVIWSGSWASGSITVPYLDNYLVYKINFSEIQTGILVVKNGTNLRGVGGNSSNAQTFRMAFFSANRSGDTLTLVDAHALDPLNGREDGALTVTNIIGIC